ncbi:hypothetical protein G5576_013696 [Homo sapiens]|uniref:Chromosome 16 open reading frame 95 n=1 Tax=Homo sapiens TaxID=9606 RepID=A0A087X224_HUMAN|nr:uncharacterized protein C16orf95 isoform 3 [Homo sapiens]KAI2580037.1 hypothetical protein KI723_161563 [Homo sapiens]KAI4056412.1 hypothetical protein G5576_013696 [Homo sapiens]|eukprot:NP_001243846.1 uncharacterized protein C16orf95 isoform 3 [Homo sapiens]
MRPLEQPQALLPGGRARGASGSAGWHSHPARRMAGKNSTFQTYKKEVCLPRHSMHPGPWAICCECQTRFGGRLPVSRVEAALPYWVPLSLRPRKQHPCWMHAAGTTAGGSAVMSACCPSSSSSRPPTRTSYRLLQRVCCPSAS